ncbi:hypothetical protein AB0A05_27150 [Streptomyces sp. NPDC046374]|uniref:hypothetical protein n=1 Tax=Streptomyces sp. NPDC046374 TaxID=3154917 RepID=UPI0033E2EA20
MNEHDETANKAGMARSQVLPHRNALRKALKALDATVHEQRPGQPQKPHGERGDAAQMLGALAGLVHQMQMPLHGGPLHGEMQKGYLNGFERDVPALFAQLGDRAGWESAFVREGVNMVPMASIQLSLAATALACAGKAMLAAALVAEGPEKLDEEQMQAVEALTKESMGFADLLTGYVEAKRAQWAAQEQEGGE